MRAPPPAGLRSECGNPSGQIHFGVCLVTDAACVAMMRKLFVGSSGRFATVIPSPRTISQACTTSGEQSSRDALVSRAAARGDGDALVEAGADTTQASLNARPEHAVRCFRGHRKQEHPQAGREDGMLYLVPLFMKAVV
jgi:hypothetical protein